MVIAALTPDFTFSVRPVQSNHVREVLPANGLVRGRLDISVADRHCFTHQLHVPRENHVGKCGQQRTTTTTGYTRNFIRYGFVFICTTVVDPEAHATDDPRQLYHRKVSDSSPQL